MQSRIGEIQALDGEIAAISVDRPEQSLKVVNKLGLEFPILADTEGVVMDLFGVRHEQGGIKGEDIARPAVFILDREGKVHWKDLTDNWRIRVRPERILEQLKQIE